MITTVTEPDKLQNRGMPLYRASLDEINYHFKVNTVNALVTARNAINASEQKNMLDWYYQCARFAFLSYRMQIWTTAKWIYTLQMKISSDVSSKDGNMHSTKPKWICMQIGDNHVHQESKFIKAKMFLTGQLPFQTWLLAFKVNCQKHKINTTSIWNAPADN